MTASLLRLRPEDFKHPNAAAEAVNRTVQRLSESIGTETRELVLRVPDSIDAAFPLVLETGALQVREVRVASIENITDPEAPWTGGVFVFWRRGPRNNIVVRHISGLDAATTYRLTLIVEGE